MVRIGDQFIPGASVPLCGVYQCSYSGCTVTFKADALGTALPPAHHLGASWKLVEVVPQKATAPAQDPQTKPAAAAPQPSPVGAAPQAKPAQAPWGRKAPGAPSPQKK